MVDSNPISSMGASIQSGVKTQVISMESKKYKWEDLNLTPGILKGLEAFGYIKPAIIQS